MWLLKLFPVLGDPHHTDTDPDLPFHCDADTNPLFTLMRNRFRLPKIIRILIAAMLISKEWGKCTDNEKIIKISWYFGMLITIEEKCRIRIHSLVPPVREHRFFFTVLRCGSVLYRYPGCEILTTFVGSWQVPFCIVGTSSHLRTVPVPAVLEPTNHIFLG